MGNADYEALRAAVQRSHAEGGGGDRFPAADILPLFDMIDDSGVLLANAIHALRVLGGEDWPQRAAEIEAMKPLGPRPTA